MAKQTPRGVPVPETTDPDNVPYDIGRLASYLDPGDLVDFDPNAINLGNRIVFLLDGDGPPNQTGVPVARGSVYFDRQSARLWLPLNQIIDSVSTLAWYRLGTDTDAEIGTLQSDMMGMVRTGDQTDATCRFGTAVVACGGAAGVANPGFLASVSFPEPFEVSIATVVVSNGASDVHPNVVLGVQTITEDGFQVLVASGDPTFAGYFSTDQVTINYVAYGV